jgi:hypothetical protein
MSTLSTRMLLAVGLTIAGVAAPRTLSADVLSDELVLSGPNVNIDIRVLESFELDPLVLADAADIIVGSPPPPIVLFEPDGTISDVVGVVPRAENHGRVIGFVSDLDEKGLTLKNVLDSFFGRIDPASVQRMPETPEGVDLSSFLTAGNSGRFFSDVETPEPAEFAALAGMALMGLGWFGVSRCRAAIIGRPRDP